MDYDKAASFWIEKDKDAKKMEKTALKIEIDEFINKHKTCALAVADGGFVRCTPIEYNYVNDCFWLFSEGGLKFKALKNNKNVCLAIYDEYEGFGKLGGMQITAVAEIIEPWSEDYLNILKFKGIRPESIKNLEHPMHLIKISPQVVDFLCSDLKNLGEEPRQIYRF